MLRQRSTAHRSIIAEPVERHGGARRRPQHVPLFIREPEASWWDTQTRATLTVVAVQDGGAGWHAEPLVSRLARLAAEDELLVVFGSCGLGRQLAVAAGLRRSLPRHDVVTVPVRHRHGHLLRDAATVERLIDAGSLPLVVTPAGALHDVTAEIASYLRADRVLRMLHTSTGADLHQVWQRAPEPSVN